MDEEDPPCTNVLSNLIGQYAAGTLPADQKHALEVHLAECESCRGILVMVLKDVNPKNST